MRILMGRVAAGVVAFSLSSVAIAEEETKNYRETTLTGDWGGMRSDWSRRGIDTEIIYKADLFANASGGIKEGARYLDNLDVMFSLDGEKLFGAEGFSAFVHFLNNNGGRPDTDLVGSAQGIDNIEVPRATAKLYQAWVQQNFMEDKISLLAGLYDLNSEFYVTDSSMLFIHSTYGIGSDIAQSGVNGPSIFPFTSPTVRLRISPTPQWYAQIAVLDGVPGDPSNVKGTHVHFRDGEGALIVAEAGFIPGGEKPSGKFGVGAWRYSEDFMAWDGSGMTESQGLYVIGEHALYSEPGGEGQGLTGFFHLGFADEDVNQFDYAWSVGLVYTGLIPGRDEGQLGLAVNGAHNGDTFRDSFISISGPGMLHSSETVLELTYSDNLTPWLNIQPDVQYIINPGTDPALDNALVLGTRLTLAF